MLDMFHEILWANINTRTPMDSDMVNSVQRELQRSLKTNT